jgi:excisionase family DNA binding protein
MRADDWLTVAEAADYARLGRDTIYTACERSELQHARVGGRRAIRLRRVWLDEWLQLHATGGATTVTQPVTPEA